MLDSLTNDNEHILRNVDYNVLGGVNRREYGNGLTSRFSYYPKMFRLEGIRTSNLQDLEYSYDNKGNVIGIDDDVDDLKKFMEYDELDRLTLVSEEDSDGNLLEISYEYDSIGNILGIISDNFEIEFVYDGLIHAPSLFLMDLNEEEILDYDDFLVDLTPSPVEELVDIEELVDVVEPIEADFNGDNKIDYDDFFLFSDNFGLKLGDSNFDSKFDLDESGKIDYDDYFIFADNFGKTN